MNVCVSGPARELTEFEQNLIYNAVEENLFDEDRLISGGAIGVDAECVNAAYDLGYPVDLVVPKDLPWAKELLILVQGCYAIPGSYMDRNDALAKRGERLIAFPETLKEELRSGTWATIRRFRKLDKHIKLYPLDKA